MLEQIQFSKQDTLYVIGDVIDRYPGGVDILREIIAAPNMQMLMGNHEDMCLKTLGPNVEYGARKLWQSNGGNDTYRELLYCTDPADRRRLLRFLENLPYTLDVTVSDQSFRLVHGWPASTPFDQIWGRPMDFLPMDLPENATAILGHTPTCYLYEPGDEPFRIYHGERFIDIDCGCGNKTSRRRLACLRLDDMAEFYI